MWIIKAVKSTTFPPFFALSSEDVCQPCISFSLVSINLGLNVFLCVYEETETVNHQCCSLCTGVNRQRPRFLPRCFFCLSLPPSNHSVPVLQRLLPEVLLSKSSHVFMRAANVSEVSCSPVCVSALSAKPLLVADHRNSLSKALCSETLTSDRPTHQRCCSKTSRPVFGPHGDHWCQEWFPNAHKQCKIVRLISLCHRKTWRCRTAVSSRQLLGADYAWPQPGSAALKVRLCMRVHLPWYLVMFQDIKYWNWMDNKTYSTVSSSLVIQRAKLSTAFAFMPSSQSDCSSGSIGATKLCATESSEQMRFDLDWHYLLVIWGQFRPFYTANLIVLPLENKLSCC